MHFLVLLLVVVALLVEKLFDVLHLVQRDSGWLRLRQRMESEKTAGVSLLWLVGMPLLVVGLLLWQLGMLAHGWLLVPAHLLIVLYSLGRDDVGAKLGAFCEAWHRGDEEAACLAARRDLGLDGGNERQLFERVQMYLLWQSYQSFFAVIFWYVLLGPLAALAYRLLDLTERHARGAELREHAGQLRHAFDWLSVRALALTFALVGNTESFKRVLRLRLFDWEVPAERLLLRVGLFSVEPVDSVQGEQGTDRLDDIWALLMRAGLLWYAGFAVWAILVW